MAKATWAKLNVLYFCELHQCANNGNSFKVRCQDLANRKQDNLFLEWKPLLLQFKIWQTFIFCKFVHFQGCFFPSNIFAPNSCQQYPFMYKVQFHTKYPLLDSQSEQWFTFSHAILKEMHCSPHTKFGFQTC